jgi:hypothetical protein
MLLCKQTLAKSHVLLLIIPCGAKLIRASIDIHQQSNKIHKHANVVISLSIEVLRETSLQSATFHPFILVTFSNISIKYLNGQKIQYTFQPPWLLE